jgi:hypothetical protein
MNFKATPELIRFQGPRNSTSFESTSDVWHSWSTVLEYRDLTSEGEEAKHQASCFSVNEEVMLKRRAGLDPYWRSAMLLEDQRSSNVFSLT